MINRLGTFRVFQYEPISDKQKPEKTGFLDIIPLRLRTRMRTRRTVISVILPKNLYFVYPIGPCVTLLNHYFPLLSYYYYYLKTAFNSSSNDFIIII